MDEKAKIRLRDYIDKVKEEREKLHFMSVEIFQQHDLEQRDFFIKVSTLSATIGAFSFLIFGLEILKTPLFLIIGDILLLSVIVLSLVNYLCIFRRSHREFHGTYYSISERQTNEIEKTEKLLNGDITREEWEAFIKDELKKIPPYKRPKEMSFISLFIVSILMIIALIFISLGFLFRV